VLYPLANLLLNNGVGALLQAFCRVVTFPFELAGGLFRGAGGLLTRNSRTSAEQAKYELPDDQLKAMSQMIRKILLNVTAVIQRADQAASDSNQTLGDVRNTIGRMDLPNGLKDAHSLLIREIDRMILGNSTLKKELSRSQVELASQRQQIEELRSAVRMDGLTQLANRAYFDEKLLETTRLQHRHHDIFSVMLIDVDNFKEINDRFGHQAGDRILKGVAFNLKSALRETDFVARFGGDEFAVILFKTNGKAAMDVAGKLCRSQTDNRLLLDGVTVGVTLSIGAAESSDTDTPETLLKRADLALYRAKSEGRNRSCYQPPEG
jgi:diguanylate cyclase